jgi:arylsulfatase A-like enzyme
VVVKKGSRCYYAPLLVNWRSNELHVIRLNRPRPLVALAALAAAVAYFAFGRTAAVKPGDFRGTNIIVITVDALRADHLGCYGYARPTSPHIDALSADSVVFDRAYAASSWTTPSLASLHTGLYPSAHQASLNTALSSEAQTMAELFARAGYRTAAFVATTQPLAKQGIFRGFETQRAEVPSADEITAWAEAAPGKPFFMWLHYLEPHGPYNPPESYARLFAAAGASGQQRLPKRSCRPAGAVALENAVGRYDAEIRSVDDRLHEFLTKLAAHPAIRRSLIVFSADHGEEFCEHRGCDHGATLYEEIIRVPLIMHFPGSRGVRRRVPQSVRSIDLAPTLLSLAGLPPAARSEGESLLPFINGATRGGLPVFAEGVRAKRSARALIVDERKIIGVRAGERWRYEVYDLGRDPGERIDLYDTSLDAELRELLQTLPRIRPGTQPAEIALTDEEMNRLRSFGYVR